MAEIAHSIPAPAFHEFSGSSPSTGAKPSFKPVAKPQPRPQVRPRLDADVEVVTLAEQVTALSMRIVTFTVRVNRLQTIVQAKAPTPHRYDDSATWDAFLLVRRAAEDGAGLTAAYHLRGRMLRRLHRWATRVTEIEPSTQAGLAAKSKTFLALQADGREWIAGPMGTAVGRDAVRIATALADHALTGDAAILSLIAQHTAAMTEWEAADDASDAPRDAYFSAMPPRPQALYWNAADRTRPAGRMRASRDSHYFVYDEDDVERMREKPATRVIEHRRPADWNPDDTIVRSERVPDEPGEVRRLQIIAAYDEWEAEKAALRDSTGLTAANDLEEAVGEVLNDLEDTILRATPNTLSGFQAKARWIARRAKPATLGIHLIRDLCSMPSVEALAPVSSEPSLEVVESYRTYLDQELRWLNWETHGSPKAIGGIWLDNPAGRLHGGDGPPPSSRAATVLSVLGLMPDRASEALAEAEDQIAARVA